MPRLTVAFLEPRREAAPVIHECLQRAGMQSTRLAQTPLLTLCTRCGLCHPDCTHKCPRTVCQLRQSCSKMGRGDVGYTHGVGQSDLFFEPGPVRRRTKHMIKYQYIIIIYQYIIILDQHVIILYQYIPRTHSTWTSSGNVSQSRQHIRYRPLLRASPSKTSNAPQDSLEAPHPAQLC